MTTLRGWPHYTSFVDMIAFWRAGMPGRFTEAQHETLVAKPEVESRRLIAACGLNGREACLNLLHNERRIRT